MSRKKRILMPINNKNTPISDRILTKEESLIGYFNEIREFMDNMEKFITNTQDELIKSKSIFISTEFIKIFVNFVNEIDMLIEKYERENDV